MGRFVVCVLALLLASVWAAKAITNGEFYEILRDSGESVEEFDISENDDVKFGDDDDNLNLPGGENDEVDTDYLIEKLGLRDLDVDDVAASESQLNGGSCRCSGKSCHCCVSHTFSVRIVFKKIKARLSACVTLEYLHSNVGFRLTFEVNGRRMYRNEISLKHPPALCYNIPGLGKFARVCLEFYDIDLGRMRMCTRVAGVIDLKVKKFRYRIKIACFRIPRLEDQQLEEYDAETTQMTSQDGEVSISNIAELFRMLNNGEISLDDLAVE